MSGHKVLRSQGFTLIELMIVVAIIALLITIALPNIVRSRMSANEAAAASDMRTISSAEILYESSGMTKNANGVSQYTDLQTLSNPPTGVPFIDGLLGLGLKHGYRFEAEPLVSDTPAYRATGTPVAPGRSGTKTYYVDQSGTIRFEADGAAAGVGSPPLN